MENYLFEVGQHLADLFYNQENIKPLNQNRMAKEPLEEAAENYSKTFIEDDGTAEVDFIAGAKWQQERMYSEEEVIRIARESYAMGRNIVLVGAFNKWLEQFKKS